MNWNALGALGEIVGAAAVVVTLFYLARQVLEASEETKRNQAEVRRTRYDALNRELSRTAAEWAANPEIADVIFRGLFDLGALSRVEVFRFYTAQQRFLRSLESLFVYSTEGGVHEWGAQGWRAALADYITFPGVRAYWDDRHHWYSEAFQSEVNSLVSDSGAVMAQAYATRAIGDEQLGSTDTALYVDD